MARRIVLLVSSMESGGAERNAASLANAWSRRGDSVLLIATFSGRGRCFYTLHPQVELVYLADLTPRSDQSVVSRSLRLLALRRLIRKRNADIVVSFLTNVNIATLLACVGLHIPVVVSERSYPPLDTYRPLQAYLRRLTYPLADRVVMLTREGQRWLHKTVPMVRSTIIPNAVAYPLPVSPPVLPPEDFSCTGRRVLLAVGRLDAGKQFDLLIRVFASLAPSLPDWDLVILGEGPEKTALQAHVERHGLEKRVMLPGLVGNVGAWYERADLYVSTSRYEGFPNTHIEAMAHGLPAVSYDCDTGPRDIIRHGIDGLLIAPVGDEPGLATALRRLMTDDIERVRMSAQAVSVRERYSMERILAMWDRVFDEVRGAQ